MQYSHSFSLQAFGFEVLRVNTVKDTNKTAKDDMVKVKGEKALCLPACPEIRTCFVVTAKKTGMQSGEMEYDIGGMYMHSTLFSSLV